MRDRSKNIRSFLVVRSHIIAVLLFFCLSSFPSIAQNMAIASFYSEYEIIGEGDRDSLIYDKQKINVGHTTSKVSMSKPIPIYGTLEIKTSPSNATVYLDGEKKGKTDFIDSQVLIGQHHIRIELQGHKTEEFDVNISEGQTEKINITLTEFCDATIFSKPTAFISVNGNPEGRTPYHVDSEAGIYRIELSKRGYITYSKTVYLDRNTPDITIRLHRNYIRTNEFYMQIGGNIMPYPSMNFGIGGYIKNFNLECNYILGLTKSKKIYWNDQSGETVPFSARYKPSGGNFKVGYGIRLFNRMRITPQIGFQFVSLSESAEESLIPDDYFQGASHNLRAANGSKAGSLTFGARFNMALAPCLGLSVTPEYLLCIGKSNGFKVLSGVTKQIKGYAEGFGYNISVNLFF